ncbi:MAG: PAS domain-containing protein, partial [Hyphomicrobiales bacterium]
MSQRRDNTAFMAWTASEPLNRLLLVDAPALVLSPDGAHMLWANPSGAARLGAGNLESLLQEEFPEALPLRRQISHLFRWLRGEQEQVQRLRLGRSAATPLDMVRVRKLRNLDGISGVLLRPVADAVNASSNVDPGVLTDWLASGHQYAALLSSDGNVISASGAFHDLRKAAADLQALLDATYDSAVPVSRRLHLEPNVRHLVTAYKMPFGDDEAFLLLVDAEEVALRQNIGRMPMSGDLLSVPIPANDTKPTIVKREDVEAEDVDLPETEQNAQITLEDLQDAIQNAVGSKVDIDTEQQRAEPPKNIARKETENSNSEIMRFVWRMDDNFKFTFVSPEFQMLVGLRGAFEGRSWQDLAGDYQLDPDKKIQAAISSKDMWGGQRVTWLLRKRKARAEIELSAMPVFDDDRKFQGYRGFGSCRLVLDGDVDVHDKVEMQERKQDVFETKTALDVPQEPKPAADKKTQAD